MQGNYNLKEEFKKDWWICGIILFVWIFTIFIYKSLPSSIPMHWNISGQADSFGPKSNIFLLPAVITGVYFLTVFVPLIDPKRANYGKFSSSYRVIRGVLVVFLSVIYFASVFIALGYKIDINVVINFFISFMLIGFGSVMGKLYHNYFVGIRTPWTLADEEVWNKTHKFGGKVWVTAGVIGVLVSFIKGTWVSIFIFILLFVAVLIPVVYSYIIYKNK